MHFMLFPSGDASQVGADPRRYSNLIFFCEHHQIVVPTAAIHPVSKYVCQALRWALVYTCTTSSRRHISPELHTTSI